MQNISLIGIFLLCNLSFYSSQLAPAYGIVRSNIFVKKSLL